MNSEFWRGRRVFLTGHTGFKGGWLALWLQRLGAEVVGYALKPPTQPNLFDVANVGAGMTSIIADVRDLEQICTVVSQCRPDIVFHMAAQPLVRYSYEHPVDTYAVNVMGTVNLLEAVRRTESIRAVVNVTSDKCYDNREWIWGYREYEPMGGFDPYSNSKGCAELVTMAFRSSYFSSANHAGHNAAIATARAGNVIGGGDWAKDRLVPDIMIAFAEKRPVAIRNPLAVRPWQHVLEPLCGYMTLAERLWQEGSAYAEAWNFGPNDEDAKPVEWIVSCLSGYWGEGAKWELDKDVHPHEARYLKLDCSKARARLGWKPRWTLQHSLSNVAAWYRAFYSERDVRALCEQQIEAYQNFVPDSGKLASE